MSEAIPTTSVELSPNELPPSEEKVNLDPSKDSSFDSEPEQYTKGACQKKRSYKFSMFVLFILFAYRGLIMGLIGTVKLMVKQNGASMEDQAFLTISNYPWILKILIAIFFDAFFIKILGKCKTYILICGIVKFIST